MESSNSTEELVKMVTLMLKHNMDKPVEAYHAFQQETVMLKEQKINELSLYCLNSLVVQVEDHQIRFSNDTTPFTLGRKGQRLVINNPVPEFCVTAKKEEMQELDKARNLGGDSAFLEAYEKLRGPQWEAHCKQYSAESMIFLKEWTIVGDALDIQFFNLNNREGCTLEIYNMRSTSLQLNNSCLFLPPGNQILLKREANTINITDIPLSETHKKHQTQ